MRKSFIILALLASFTALSVKASEVSDKEKDGIEAEVTPVTIVVSGAQVHVSGAEGQMLEVYNLAGVRVAVMKIDSEDKSMTLNLPKGCYILRVGNTARKVSIR
ncbi:MAG: T9SS type A sorting domain-containing protein [Bacteroidaceae bacterium]|jgi:hypothetical protein|nr:T9SS type A sorting domain-containing protein [Bacteroidaceae bacterium]MBR4243326.1 T9SS type A sorting domain-containing protein [Bacteroidaceae bacterium]